MDNITIIGVDLAKHSFQVCALNRANKVVFNKAITRHKLMAFLLQYPNATIVMEACASAHHWSRELMQCGLRTQLLPAQHVASMLRGNKNDANDALAIAEASRRPNLHAVQTKTLEQQDIQLLLRIRSKTKDQRKDNVNQIRGFLAEYGIIIPKGLSHIGYELPFILEDAENRLTPIARAALSDLLTQHYLLTDKIKQYDQRLTVMAQQHPIASLLLRVRGIGPITALAIFASIGKGIQFKNARQLSAWLGLVPAHSGTGGVLKLRGMSKRGNVYLRTLLIHGARTVMNWASRRDDTLSLWSQSVSNRCGRHKAIVAVANKTARMVWVVLHKGVDALPKHYLSA